MEEKQYTRQELLFIADLIELMNKHDMYLSIEINENHIKEYTLCSNEFDINHKLLVDINIDELNEFI